MVKIKTERWKVAQKNEKKFWENSWKEKLDEKEDLSQAYWKSHQDLLNEHLNMGKETKLLEIGGGATPFIAILNSCEKYSLDPLMDYFRSNFKLPKGIKYIQGVGEKLPFEDGYFDFVLITNVIDHVNNPSKVLSEIKKVLKKGGILYLSVDCHNLFLKNYKITKEFLGWGDPPHPHSFSVKSMKKLIEKSGLNIIHIQKGFGNQGVYTAKEMGDLKKEPLIVKAFKIMKEKGMVLFLDALTTKILISFGNLFLPERDRTDFIFIANKAR